jgi:hypothetical protein
VGRGKLSFGKGGQFTGTFKDDEVFEGKLVDKNENSFDNDTAKGGHFLRGKLNGAGKARFSNGNDYVGEFKDGLMSGQGQITYKELGSSGSKAVYIGSFRGNKRDGFGTMTWGQGKEGETFKGLWHNDRRVKGCLRLADGT